MQFELTRRRKNATETDKDVMRDAIFMVLSKWVKFKYIQKIEARTCSK